MERLERLREEALSAIAKAVDRAALDAWKVKYLGRSSELAGILQRIGELPREDRPRVGRRANVIKGELEAAFQERMGRLEAEELEASLREERLDVTLPGRPIPRGRLHPSTQTLIEVYRIWAEMGFQVYTSREVELDELNFSLLNMPPHHPARDMQDTFYTTDPDVLLRTHTSPGQIRVMRERAPEPIRVILPGMCFRYEQITARADIQFNQVEGLAVGHRITFGDLKGTLSAFARRLFGKRARTRFRASYFPFTEPSAEMDVECFLCLGEGCSVCKGTGWLEILGCGMVHPIVLRNGGYAPEAFTGFAFGMGVERMAMMRHDIEDIRAFWANDLRFLEQF
jgi:phenylalanyl-tRNA synthetase alpha chain